MTGEIEATNQAIIFVTMKKAFGLFLLLMPFWAFSQSFQISGVVLDSTNGDPLPFVNIIVNDKPIGTTTDIDGRFSLTSPQQITSLTFSYVGYKKRRLEKEALNKASLKVYLSTEGVEMKDVVVLPGENPAHRIVENATANRKANNPEALPSFSYTAYNKMFFTVEKTGDPQQEPNEDDAELDEFLGKQHLFLSETVSERKFKSGKNSEKVLATRVSGLKDPTFTVMATQFQSFSFYDDYFNLGDKNYLNPISKGSTDKYLFLLEDTIYSGADSVFVLSYRPRKGKNFDALKGLIYITSDGWAVKNVTAQAVDAKNIELSIQQQYEKISGQWFPVQLNTDLVLKTVDINNAHMKGVGRAYLSDILINPELKNNQFSQVEMEIMPDATSKSEEFWNQYRRDRLSDKDKLTYHVIDSIGKEANLDKKLKLITSLSSGRYPVGPIDIDLKRLLSVNNYETVRLGLGAHTNDKVSRFFKIGGWWGYGFKDKAAKYGGDVQLTLHRNSELALMAEYQKEIPEAGRPVYLIDRKPNPQELYRKYYLGRRDNIQEWRFSIGWRMLKYLKLQVGLAEQYISTTDAYQYGTDNGQAFVGVNQFNFTEAFVGMRYAFREKILRTKDADYSGGTKYPVLWVTASKGLNNVWNGTYEYYKVDGKLEHSFIIRNLGIETYQISAGWVSSGVPYSKLYKGRGNYQDKLPAASENAFETMGINEFLANRYVTIYHTHNFGSLLLKTKRFAPALVLVNNIGFGWLDNPDLHHNVPVRSFEHGYFETGLRIDNILKLNFSGFGTGIYYRYGGYQNPELIDNVAAKLTLTFVL